MKRAHQFTKKQFYTRPDFYDQLTKVLGKRKYLKKRDYTGMPKKVAVALEKIHCAEEQWREMREQAVDDIEAYLIRRFPNESMTIQCASINLHHPKAYDLLCILAKTPNFKGKI
jgi:hypothetical protein